MPKKVKKEKHFFSNKYQSVTHVSTSIFQGLFRSVALVMKKLWAILDFFFTHSGLFTFFYRLVPYLMHKKRELNKILFQRVKQDFISDS